MDDKELYYDLSKFAANMMANRSNFMLVFQSILFATVVAMSSGKMVVNLPYLPFCLVGLCSAIVWLYLNYLTTCQEDAIFKKLREADSRIGELLDSVYEKNVITKVGRISQLMTYPLPLIIIGLWLSIVVNAYGA